MVTAQPARNFAGTLKTPARTPVTLDKSKDFKQFDSLLAQTHEKGADMCLGCARYEVTATLVGRLDSVADATMKRDASGKIVGFGGFGNMNAYPARLVLESVSDVTPKEIDYSKTDAIQGRCGADSRLPARAVVRIRRPVCRAQMQLAAHMASRSGRRSGQERPLAAISQSAKEQNGVSVVFGAGNEVTPDGPGHKGFS